MKAPADGRRPGIEAALADMILSTILFTIMAVWPALSWRIRFGVWMG